MRGAVRSVRRTTAAVMGVMGRRRRRTRYRSAAGWPRAAWAGATSSACSARSMPASGRSRRKARGMARKTIEVDYLARVEGEGGLRITFRDRAVQDVELRIFEPPRFFEAFLRGRSFMEAPDITARICGICPVAYQMSSVHAMEDALGVTVSEPVRELRRLLYCGEWIESHTLHVYMLHAPDFLGYDGAVEMAKDHGDGVRQGLELKKAGNEILELLGGRAIHPVNVRVGGFYRAPSRAELRTLIDPMELARQTALDTVRWAAELPFPDVELNPLH